MGITVLFVTHNIDDAVIRPAVLVMSSLPTVIMENIVIDLPDERSQLKMRSLAHFAELRKHLYEQIQAAKQVQRPA